MVKHVFRVGDRVRFVEPHTQDLYGSGGTVERLDDDGLPYGVRIEGADAEPSLRGELRFFSADELELVDGRLSDSEALDRIADVMRQPLWWSSAAIYTLEGILRETGREL